VNLTKESEYALKGLALLARHPPGEVVSLAEIAEVQQLPSTFLAKIFQKLARHGLLEAERGRGSGYTLREAPAGIRVRDVLEAIEGPLALKRCVLWAGTCSESDPCPLHHRLKEFRSQVDRVLDEVTLAEYAEVSIHGKSPTSDDSGVT
jgi:Rrf2 family protein